MWDDPFKEDKVHTKRDYPLSRKKNGKQSKNKSELATSNQPAKSAI